MSDPAPRPSRLPARLPRVAGQVRSRAGRVRLPGGGAGYDGVDRFVRRASRTVGEGGRKAYATVAELLPHVPVRDLATLRAHHHGLEGEELADALVRNAATTVAAVGVAGGALLLTERKVPAWVVALPVTLAAEVAVVAAVEAKLVAELHEVYGVPLRRGTRSRTTAAAAEWASRRDIDPTDLKSLRVVAGLAAGRPGGRRLAGRTGRLARTGTAVVGGATTAAAYRRSLTDLADDLRRELRTSPRRRIDTSAWPPW